MIICIWAAVVWIVISALFGLAIGSAMRDASHGKSKDDREN